LELCVQACKRLMACRIPFRSWKHPMGPMSTALEPPSAVSKESAPFAVGKSAPFAVGKSAPSAVGKSAPRLLIAALLGQE
jgi:hypothetical protein